MLMAVGPVYRPSKAVCPFCIVHAALSHHGTHRLSSRCMSRINV